MKKFLLVASIIVCIFFLSHRAIAQGNQTVVSGSQTNAVNFPAGGCTYTWVNNTPGIGLAANGTGDIAAFKAVNTGNTPITATISATPTSMVFAYIPNQFSNNVSVVNTTTNMVVATILVGAHPTGVSVSPDGSKVYISNNSDNTVSVINTATNTVSSTITVGTGPYGICVSPDGSHVYVANYNSGTVSIISTISNTVIATVNVGSYPYGIAVSPDGTRVYCASSNDDTLSEINTATNTVIATVAVGPHPYGVVVSNDGTRVYVSSAYSNTVTVINTTNNTTVATITASYVSDTPAMSLSPDGSRLYLVDTYIAIINTATNAILNYIPANTPYGVSISPDGNFLYLTDENTSTLSTVNLATNTGVASVKVGLNPISFGNFVKGPSCQPITFTITVKPSSVTPVITAGAATGTISACQGSPSASPNIQQFSLSGTGLTNNITATAPTGFEVSLSANGVYSSTVTITQSGGIANNTTVYVRSTVSASGNITGNVVLSSPGASPQNVAVSGKINPLPIVNNPGNQTVANGAATTAINFTGTGNIFNWTNDTPGIGLAASGAGNISAFTAINAGTTPITAKITVMSVNKQAGYEYMTNETTNQVTVVSNVTNSIVSTIDVGTGPYGITLSPDGSMAYVSNYIASSVSVINTSSNKVVATIPVGNNPIGIAISPDGSKVYVCAGFGLYIIDATKNQILTSFALANYSPTGMTVSPDGKWLYVADANNNSLLIIDASTYQQTRISIPTNIPASAFNVAVSPDGRLIYLTGGATDNVYVISSISQTIVKTINLNAAPIGIAISPDGKRIYVTNNFSNTVSVIDAISGTPITTITVGTAPEGISVSPDGSTVYVANVGSNTMSVINTADNQVTATVAAGPTPHSLGNFVKSSISCSGPPITFTITVNPTPTITASAVTGTISACEDSPSESPHIAQFTVSGNSLTNDIVATAPSGFEVSLSATGVYGNIVTIPQSAGVVNNVTVYVRSAASAIGNISGNVILTSQGANSQSIAVTGTINPLPTVNIVSSQTIKSGSSTNTINFTGTANVYNWVNDNPAIGATSGTGNISSFTAINTGNSPITGTFTVTPLNTTTGCSGTPITFTIEVDPILPAVITTTGTLSSLSTIYGTFSTSASFNVSGTNMNAGILVTPPTGFEVSTDNTNFSQTVTVGAAGTITGTTVYIRLTSKTPVGNYSGNITLSSNGATDVNVSVPNSIVNPAPLTITANNVQKRFGQTLTSGFVLVGFTSIGLRNNETIGNVFLTYGEGADASAKAGNYTGSVVPSNASDGSFDPKNYTITYNAGAIIVTESLAGGPIAIPNAFTPNGDGINDVWNIKSLIDYPSCLVSIFTRYGSLIYQSRGYAKPWDGNYNGNQLPTGTYYYIINLQNGQQPLSGYVALIR